MGRKAVLWMLESLAWLRRISRLVVNNTTANRSIHAGFHLLRSTSAKSLNLLGCANVWPRANTCNVNKAALRSRSLRANTVVGMEIYICIKEVEDTPGTAESPI